MTTLNTDNAALRTGINRLSNSLGRFIDPAGHAKDDARRKRARQQSAALRHDCPTCGALARYACHTLTTNQPTAPHAARRNQ